MILGLAPTLALFQSAPRELHKVMAPWVITKVNSRGSMLEAGIDGSVGLVDPPPPPPLA